ncbi:MAG: MBL fold metallo-hydrolase [Phycisphaerae bacterium]|nr:MBL fold metallo-hydrolase [Phycisphaerae bacterium]
MLFRLIYDDHLAQAAYLIGCQRTGEAIVIDPERDVDRYLDLAKREGLRLVAATETHIHADFVSGSRELAERGVKVFLSGEGGPDWSYQWQHKRTVGGTYDHQLLRNGDVIKVGNIEIKALHTPGHTPEHLSFLVTDRGGGAAEPMGIATGDFVFVGDLGRPDLLESAAGQAGVAAPSARTLFKSVATFASLPDYVQVWPGHGAGSACGKALGAVPQSTVGYERRFNPAIAAAKSEGAFVDYILSGQPEPPRYFARMKKWNKEGPPVLGGVPKPRRAGADELARLDARAVAIIDTRTWREFMGGHLAGSLYIPFGTGFPTEAGSLIEPSEPIHLIIDEPRLDDAVRDLIRVGLDRVESWSSPASVAEAGSRGGTIVTSKEISPEAARSRLGAFFVLDARKATEHAEVHIDGATQVSHTQIVSNLARLPKDRPILVHCKSGGRSARVCAFLDRLGYDATNLAGGITAWQQQGLPTKP